MRDSNELHCSECALPECHTSLNEEQRKFLPEISLPCEFEEDSALNTKQNARLLGLLEERGSTTLKRSASLVRRKLISMDRSDGIIRWSPNPARNEFLTINVNYRIIKLFRAVGYAVPERFDFQQLSKHSDFQLVTAFDWSPKVAGLVALGTKDGQVQLLRIDDDSNDCITLPLKLQRTCQAVAFNTTGLLAVGLDRVRNDQCLQIWDINQRLSRWDPFKKGWQSPAAVPLDPVSKLEASLAIASVKFFEDQPQTLVVGVKNQSVRIHDLRDPNGAAITFQTRCNNNLAIDHADTNYFASSALDQAGVMIWDRRAGSRQSASKMYLDSVDAGNVPFGCALKISKAIDPRNGSFIRSIRYCRDQRGLLAVLSTSGELQAFSLQKEYVEPVSENDVEGSPELLQVKRSHPLRYPYFHENFPYPHDERVVSFDWMTLGSSFFQPRVIIKKSNQKSDIILKPTTIQHFAFDLINFSGPVKRYGEDFSFPNFSDPKEAEYVLGPIALTPLQCSGVFRPPNVNTSISHSAINTTTHIFTGKDSSADPTMLKLLSGTLRWAPHTPTPNKPTKTVEWAENSMEHRKFDDTEPGLKLEDLSLSSNRPLSSREQHEQACWIALEGSASEGVILTKLKRQIIRRCKNGYLFDCAKNRAILADDPWLQGVWQWIEGAADMAKDNGMVSGSLDLSYMSVYTIWNNDLGNKFLSRLIDTTTLPSAAEWEHAIGNMNKTALRDNFDGCKTERPHHRRLCLATCGWGKSVSELDEQLKELEAKGEFTKAAAWALYEKVPKRAVEILKRGGKDLLFIALALNLQLQGAKGIEEGDWDDSFKQHPQMMHDPYLRAIYAFTSTGNWNSITEEASLPFRDRVGVAVRNFSDDELTEWLEKQMAEAIKTGDIEGIVLAGITDKMVEILAQYHEKFGDFQTVTLIISYGAPLYIVDYRTSQWREEYRNYLNANKLHIDRCKFDVRTTKMSRRRDGTTVIKLPPRQITLRCVRCDSEMTNDKDSTANPPAKEASSATTIQEQRNPLYHSGVHAGISCPKCGRHLGRCAICLQILGLPRIDRQDLSTKAQDLMKNFMAFCLKCDHASHADHYEAWFERHNECPVADCHCPCNMSDLRIKKEQEAHKKASEEEERREVEGGS